MYSAFEINIQLLDKFNNLSNVTQVLKQGQMPISTKISFLNNFRKNEANKILKFFLFGLIFFRLVIFYSSPFLSYSAELSACWQQCVMNTKSFYGKKAKKTWTVNICDVYRSSDKRIPILLNLNICNVFRCLELRISAMINIEKPCGVYLKYISLGRVECLDACAN
jgi:hypothetical protein